MNEKGLGVRKKLVENHCEKFTRNTKKVNVGYYSGRWPNHSKTLRLFSFSGQFFLFIAAPPSRCTDHGVVLNSTPTLIIHNLYSSCFTYKKKSPYFT